MNECRSLQNTARTQATIATIFAGAAIVVGGVGLTLILTSSSGDGKKKTGTTTWVAPSLGGATAGLTF